MDKLRAFDTPHDLLARAYFGDRRVMRRFLEGFLPPHVSAALDYDSLQDSKETFLTPGLKKSMGDLVFRCRSRAGDEGTIYVLFEHKSHPEQYCAVQVLRYMALIWEDALKTPGKKRLPFILPLVFYHGKERWTGKPLGQLFPQDTPFAPYIPDFSLLLYDLSQVPEDTLKAGLTNNAMLLLLKALHDDLPARKLVEAFRLLASAAGGRDVAETIRLFFTYLEQARPDITPEDIAQEMAALPSGDTTMQTFMERFSEMAFERGMLVGKAEGRAEGEAEGEARGEARGEIAATRRLIAMQVGRRFDVAPVSLTTRLKKLTDMEALTTLAGALLEVPSLEAFEALVDKALEGHGAQQ